MVTIIAPIPSNKCRLGRRRGAAGAGETARPPRGPRSRGGGGGGGGGRCPPRVGGGTAGPPGRGWHPLPGRRLDIPPPRRPRFHQPGEGGSREVIKRRRSRDDTVPPAWLRQARSSSARPAPVPAPAPAPRWLARPGTSRAGAELMGGVWSPAGLHPSGACRSSLAHRGCARATTSTPLDRACGAEVLPAHRGAVAAGPVGEMAPSPAPPTSPAHRPAGGGWPPRLGCSWMDTGPGPSPSPDPDHGLRPSQSAPPDPGQSICVPAPVTSVLPGPSQPSVAQSSWPSWLRAP